MPENPSATAFGAEVLWFAGVVIGATLVIAGTRAAGRKAVHALKNRKK